jgi:transposase-like protein
MADDQLCDAPLLLGLLWLCLLLYWAWRRGRPATCQTTPTHAHPIKKRSCDPKPFPGLIHKPHYEACEPAVVPHRQAPSVPPPRLIFTRGRRRAIDTRQQFCPDQECTYYSWVGRGTIRANGHPGGKPWRQFQCVACQNYFQETHGTPVHGTRVSPKRLVWAVGALAEGLGICAVARVFEVDPHTVLQWLVEAADHLRAFSRYFLHDVRVTQVQLDELYAVVSVVKAGQVNEREAIERLSRSPHWVWGAIDPVTKLLLALDSGDRTIEMAQRLAHGAVEVFAPGFVPLFLTDGFKEYATAPLTHFGPGCSHLAGRLKVPPRSPVGCHCPRCSVPRWSNSIGVDAWSACATAWCSAPWPESTGCWPLPAGRSTRPSLSVRTARFASMWRRSVGASSRSAKARRAHATSWPSTTGTIPFACLTPAYAGRCRSPCRPTGRAQRDAGGPVRRPWPPG